MTSFNEVLNRLEQLLGEVELFPPQIRDTVLEILDGVDLMHRMALDRLATRLGPERLAEAQTDPLVSWLFEAYGQGAAGGEDRANDRTDVPENPSDVAVAVEAAPPERRPAIMRAHLQRLAKASPAAGGDEAGEWIDLQAGKGEAGTDLAEAWLTGLVEVPTEQMEQTIRSSLQALETRTEDTAAKYRSQVSRAMARFHPPQWMRLKDAFNRIAEELGQPANWG